MRLISLGWTSAFFAKAGQSSTTCPRTSLLVYEPEVGWHENVAEYDFTSMYPEMMVQHNISPETVNCACCPDNLVPEIGHHLCRQRRGLVPSVLAPILEKRARYKALSKAGGPSAGVYKKRATAHKWCLVCCFGYLGFKNARFGKIESHECVTAWGREVLLRAKDVVERRGFHLLHALVDALWVKVEPGTDLEELRIAAFAIQPSVARGEDVQLFLAQIGSQF